MTTRALYALVSVEVQDKLLYDKTKYFSHYDGDYDPVTGRLPDKSSAGAGCL